LRKTVQRLAPDGGTRRHICLLARPVAYNSAVPFALRDFKQDDFETLWRLDQECFAAGIAYSRPELKSYIRHPRGFTLVAEEAAEAAAGKGAASSSSRDETRAKTDGRLIAGFIVAANGQVGHIITIDVRASARRSGVGSMLLRAAEERLRVAGSFAVGLETAVDNLGALSFYKRNGYSVVRTWPRYYSNGVDALVLKKSLEAA
jgi:[ribosomal protein S18]-alanine N-acetyltransferase